MGELLASGIVYMASPGCARLCSNRVVVVCSYAPIVRCHGCLRLFGWSSLSYVLYMWYQVGACYESRLNGWY